MPDFQQHSDGELVALFREGDSAAFMGIYDRYADRIYSFCLTMLRGPDEAADATRDTFVEAAARLGNLDDVDDLRPWLFALTRNEVRAEGRQRAKVRPERDELRTLVWQAVDGLGQRDQELMALHLIEGLEGEDLAQAMGVEMSHLDVLVARMRGRVEKALGPLLIARLGRDQCSQLDQLLGDWAGDFDAEVRARVTRHVAGCEICRDRRELLIAPANVLPGIMVVAAPTSLRHRVLDDVVEPPGPPSSATPAKEPTRLGDLAMLWIFAAFTLLLGLIGFAVAAQFQPIEGPGPTGPPVAEASTTTSVPEPTSTTIAIGTTEPGSNTTQPGAPGVIELSTDTIDFGDEATTGRFEISNTGGQPISFSIEPSVETIVLSAGGEELGAGETVTYDVVLDREAVTEGEVDETITVVWEGGTTAITVTGAHMDNPILHNPQADPPQVDVSGGADCPDTVTTISVRIRDRSPLESVVVRWSPDGGSNRETPMNDVGGDIFEAEIGPFTTVHTASARVVAIDEFDNAGGTTLDVPVEACP